MLAALPDFNPQFSGLAGYHSEFVPVEGGPEWVQVDLGRDYPIDVIALVPAVLNVAGTQVRGHGFPRRFRVDVSNDLEFKDFKTVGDYTAQDVPNPGMFPFLLYNIEARARYVRITSTRHAEWASRGFFFALGELIVLSGERNVAAWRPVQASSQVSEQPLWDPVCLVDQFSVLPPAFGTETSPSRGFLSEPTENIYSCKSISLDLGREYPIDEIRIYPARSKDRAHVPGWGMPQTFRIKVSPDADFTDAKTLVDLSERKLQHWSDTPLIYPVGSRYFFGLDGAALRKTEQGSSYSLDPVPARYVRISVTCLDDRIAPTFLALSEVQVYADNENVALGAKVTVSDVAGPEHGSDWHPDFLVDGYASQHDLIAFPKWLRSFQQRRTLEDAITVTQRELAVHRSQFWTVGGFSVGFVLLSTITSLLFINRRQRRRARGETEELRKRIASDLHDDIGSNLGTIALISELLYGNPDIPDEAREDLKEIHDIAIKTSDAMRDVIWILRPADLGLSDFVARLRNVAMRMLPKCEVEFDSPDQVSSSALGIEWRRNVFLAFKEVIHNIARHSNAETVTIHAAENNGELSLSIVDDGIGFDVGTYAEGHGVDNVKTRLQRLAGVAEYRADDGTTVILRVPIT